MVTASLLNMMSEPTVDIMLAQCIPSALRELPAGCPPEVASSSRSAHQPGLSPLRGRPQRVKSAFVRNREPTPPHPWLFTVHPSCDQNHVSTGRLGRSRRCSLGKEMLSWFVLREHCEPWPEESTFPGDALKPRRCQGNVGAEKTLFLKS